MAKSLTAITDGALISADPGRQERAEGILTGRVEFSQEALAGFTAQEKSALVRHRDFPAFVDSRLLDALCGKWRASKMQLLALRWLEDRSGVVGGGELPSLVMAGDSGVGGQVEQASDE